MAEAILELDSDTRIVEYLQENSDDSDTPPILGRITSKVVKVAEKETPTTEKKTSEFDDKLTDSAPSKSKMSKKQAVEAQRKRKETSSVSNSKGDGKERGTSSIGNALGRGEKSSTGTVNGVPAPLPVPENYDIPKRVARTPPRSAKSRTPSGSRSPRRRRDRHSPRRRSPRRRYSSSRSRSPVRRRSRSPWSRRRTPPIRFRDDRFPRSPRRWSPRRSWDREDRWSVDVGSRGPPCPPPHPYERYEERRGWYPPDVQQPWSTGPSGPGPSYEEHSQAWSQAPPPPVMARPVLSLPEDMTRNPVSSIPPDHSISLFKEELGGLQEMVKNLASQLAEKKNSSSSNVQTTTSKMAAPSQNEAASASPTPPVAVLQKQNKSTSQAGSRSAATTKKKPAKTLVSPDPDLLAPDSEIDTPVEEESSDEEDTQPHVEENSDDEEVLAEETADTLEWPALVSLIVNQFSDRIGPEQDSPKRSRISNLGGMTAPKVSERKRLPMFEAIHKELRLFSGDVKDPPNKAKSKKDSKPLGRGCFPPSERGLPVQALSGMLRFNHPAQVEPEVDKLLPGNKNSYNVQGRLTEENMRSLERDLRVNLSSLSYVLWALDFASENLKELAEDAEDSEMILPAYSAVQHALSFMSTVVDRSSTALTTTILTRRDSYLAQIDALLPEEEIINLRSSGLMDTRLFAGQASSALPVLETKRKYFKERESVQALTSLAKKGVEKSQGSSYSPASKKNKKSKKNYQEKKGKQSYSSNAPKAGGDTASSGAPKKKSFRSKKGKSSKQ